MQALVVPSGRGLSGQWAESASKGLRDTVNCEEEAESNWALSEAGRLLRAPREWWERDLTAFIPITNCPFDGLEWVQSSSMTCGWPVVAGTSEALALGCGSVVGLLVTLFPKLAGQVSVSYGSSCPLE